MRFKQINPQHVRNRYRSYSFNALTSAYQQCKENNIPVKRAAKIYNVPVSTLRDRVLGKIDPDTAVIGKAPLFSLDEEVKLVNHVKTMSSFGYGYTRQECIDLASNYACQLGKRDKKQPLTTKWIRGFLKRWPELKVLKPRGLEYARAKMASEETVSAFFRDLGACIEQHGLADKPHLIFNLDEKGITTDHRAPYVVADSAYCPSAITSGKGKTVTLLGCGSAIGVSIPPFFVFPGKRMNDTLMQGKSPGAAGTTSESGWSNNSVFREYLETHFTKHIPGRDKQKVLLIVDGHKSHVSVDMSEWCLQHGIVLYILPAHTSHILQPLDIACYGPFQRMFSYECHKLMRETAANLTKYNVCEISCKVYTKALSPENLQAAFRRTGIYPLNKDAVPREHLVPAQLYQQDQIDETTTEQADPNENGRNEEMIEIMDTEKSSSSCNIFEEKELKLKQIKNETKQKPRKTMSKIVSGKQIDMKILQKMKEHESSHKVYGIKSKRSVRKNSNNKQSKACSDVSKPGPSHCAHISDNEYANSNSDNGDEQEESLCCVCKTFTPDEVSKCESIIFVKWTQCDGVVNVYPCKHWVHLSFCSSVRVIRKGVTFFCPHCKKEE